MPPAFRTGRGPSTGPRRNSRAGNHPHGLAWPDARTIRPGPLAGGTLDGVRLFSPDLVAEATRVQYAGPDLVLDRDAHWTLGMQWEPDGSWGMGGIGGSSAWADPERGYTFAYATTRLADHNWVDELVEALHSCL